MSEKNNKQKNDDISLPKKILMIIGSLFIALVLWYVGTTQNHTPISKQFTDIPVMYKGDITLRQNGFWADELGNIHIDVVLKGYASDIFSIKTEDLVAIVDVSEYNKSGKYTISPVIEGLSDEISVSRIDTVDINIEKLVKKQLVINVEFEGKPYRGYEIDESATTVADTVEILCKEDLAKNIVGAKVTVNVDSKKETFTINANIEFIDANGVSVNTDGAILEFENINVTVPIQKIP